MVFVNNYTRRTFIGSPFGGVKGSGFGREYAPETLHEFVRARTSVSLRPWCHPHLAATPVTDDSRPAFPARRDRRPLPPDPWRTAHV